MSELIEVKIEKMYPDVELPAYKHNDDSGMDIKAYFSDEWVKKSQYIEVDTSNNEKWNNKKELETLDCDAYRSYTLPGGVRTIIPTGIKVAIPNGYEIQVRPRSGMAFKQGITVLNTPGTIDAGYRGEIGIILFNTGKYDDFVTINHGDRIAQLVLQKVPKITWDEVNSVDETIRGEGGFGSTGKS